MLGGQCWCCASPAQQDPEHWSVINTSPATNTEHKTIRTAVSKVISFSAKTLFYWFKTKNSCYKIFKIPNYLRYMCDGLYKYFWLPIYLFSEKKSSQRVLVLVFLIAVGGNNCYTYRPRLFLWIKYTLNTEKTEIENWMMTDFFKSVQIMYDEELWWKFRFKMVLDGNF